MAVDDIRKPERDYAILVVDHDGDNLEAFRVNFRKKFNILTCGSADEALAGLRDPERDFAVIITESKLPGGAGGVELITKAASLKPNIVGLIMSGHADPAVLVNALNTGLTSRFILKPWKPDEMEEILADALARYHQSVISAQRAGQTKAINEYLKDEIKECRDYETLVGAGGGLKDVMEQARRVAASSGHVLFHGEAGSGRELIARALHHLSPRAERAFIKFDVAAMQPKNIDAELFGVEKSSAGLSSIKRGRLELANGSSIYIDDVAELPIETQIKLARALTEKGIERVGGSDSIRVDVRVMAATRRNLEAAIARRQFREELFRLISVFTISVPPLRERKEDIPALFQSFVAKYGKRRGAGAIQFEAGVVEKLEAYDWPGNVLELERVTERAVMIAESGRITAENLGFATYTHEVEKEASEAIPESPPQALGGDKSPNLRTRLDELERAELVDAIEKSGGHMSNAARMLGINRSTMYYRMKKFGLSPK